MSGLLALPPKDIQDLINKTAEFVAETGREIELRIWEAEKNNPKFSFLRPGDPYRAYYDQKIQECLERLEIEASEQEEEVDDRSEEEPEVSKEPTKNSFYVPSPLIAKIDMDIIKITAQFVAKNGGKFLVGLTERELKNPQFDFLKPNHALFSYFTSLVEAYSGCLLPKRADIEVLQDNMRSKENILQRCLDRFNFEMSQVKGAQTEQEQEQERSQMMAIDWHDFIVVETIELNDEEELPPPIDPGIVHTLDSRLVDEPPEVHINRKEFDEAAKRAKAALAAIDKNKKLEVDHGIATDIHNYTQKCPKCGMMVSVDDFPEHIRLELLDKRYKREREEARVKEKQPVFASNEEISKNLKKLALSRPDIFDPTGSQLIAEQSFSLGGKNEDIIPSKQLIGDEKKEAPKGLIPEEVTQYAQELRKANLVMPQETSKFDIPTSIKPSALPESQIPSKIFVQPRETPSVVQPLAGPSYQARPVKERTSHNRSMDAESALISEQQWAHMHPGPVTVNIKVPEVGGDEGWGFRGQIIQVQMDIMSSVQQLKATLSTILGDMPIHKMKLKTTMHNVLKDKDSLAKYNFVNGNMAELSVKERGGRRKNK
mmetsp:Transcript_23914/g.42348  ORF Transcript_23914/g.42348 Transcript_23914/m.42348 type:complete len:600 (+) Transcript_23914:339-2138(+)